MEYDTGTEGSDTEPASDGFDRWQVDTAETLRRAETARVEVYVHSLLPPLGVKESQQRV
jgi:hypothetical protein